MYRIITLTCLLFTSSLLTARAEGDPTENSSKGKTDPDYITDMSSYLNLRLYGINKFNKFQLSDAINGGHVDYAPNENFNVGFAVNYKWLGLGIAVNVPFINHDNDLYGETRRLDAQTSIFARKFVIDFYFQLYRGFYIENAADLFPSWKSGDPYPQRPDIGVASLGASYYYIFNSRRFSARAAFAQTELQKRSAGSWLAGGYVITLGAAGDSVLIPEKVQQLFSGEMLFYRLSQMTVGLTGGYSHTFSVKQKWNINLTIVPGVAWQLVRADYPSPESSLRKSQLAMRLQSRFNLGFNGQRSFGGFTVLTDNYGMQTGTRSGQSGNFTIGSVRVYYGRRFRISR
ncbi:MAG: hypothetical protein Kow00127_12130 [Bacteroidales bacterium]